MTPSTSLELVAFNDADQDECAIDRKNTSAYYIFLGDYLLSQKRAKQKVVFRSSTKSEYRAFAYATTELKTLSYM